MPFQLNGGPAKDVSYAPLTAVTGGREVVATGSVVTADNKSLEFNLSDLRVTLEFHTDGASPRYGEASVEGSSLKIPLFNFNNPLGSGTTEPLEIGTLAQKKLYLAFVIHALTAESAKTVHFTFMVGDAA